MYIQQKNANVIVVNAAGNPITGDNATLMQHASMRDNPQDFEIVATLPESFDKLIYEDNLS